MDQGILAILDASLPGCEANNDAATWARTSGDAQSVVKGQPCPSGFEPAKDNEVFPNNSYYICKLTAGSPMPTELKNRLNVCAGGAQSPAPSPSEPSTAPGFPIWAIILIVVGGVIFLLLLSTY